MVAQITVSLLGLLGITLYAAQQNVVRVGIESILTAIALVAGGTLGVTSILYPWRDLISAIPLLAETFFLQKRIDQTRHSILSLARAYRKGGIRAMEKQARCLSDELAVAAAELFSCRSSKEKITEILHGIAHASSVQRNTAYQIASAMAKIGPAVGIIASIFVLIRLCTDVAAANSALEKALAVFPYAFSGIILAVLIFAPASMKLKECMEAEAVRLDLVLEGIMAIHEDLHPRMIEGRLEDILSRPEGSRRYHKRSAPLISPAKMLYDKPGLKLGCLNARSSISPINRAEGH